MTLFFFLVIVVSDLRCFDYIVRGSTGHEIFFDILNICPALGKENFGKYGQGVTGVLME